MPTLRFRVEINKGGEGATMSKLVSITQETEKFLLMLVRDLGVKPDGKWIAKEFVNASIEYNAEWVGSVSSADLEKFNASLRLITAPTVDFADFPTRIRPALYQYAQIAKGIDEDESVSFGIFGTNGSSDQIVDRPVLSKQRSIQIEEALEVDDKIEYLGSIQGVIHSVVAEGKRSFKIRELYSSLLIKCNYDDSLYDDVVSALTKASRVIHVEGWFSALKSTQKVVEVRVTRIEPAVQYKEGDVEAFVGLLARGTEGDNRINGS